MTIPEAPHLVRPWAMPARFGWYVIEDVEHGRYDVRAVDTTERDTTKGAK